uniref:Uncharacterized protein n=1 Tax=Picea glauca TaxID=3330 RepID=A0A117NGD3_PICGL|nr:hypothetical protein ABT39_MTgene1714 [Picea glauca]
MVFVKGNWLFCSAMVRCFYGAKEISKQAGKQARSTYYYIKVRERGFKRFCSYHCDGQLRCFYRGDLSVSVLTTAMVFQREKIISGNTSAMVEEIEPISLPLRWSNPIQLKDGFTEGKRTFLFIPLPLSYQGAPYSTKGCFYGGKKNVSVHTTAP